MINEIDMIEDAKVDKEIDMFSNRPSAKVQNGDVNSPLDLNEKPNSKVTTKNSSNKSSTVKEYIADENLIFDSELTSLNDFNNDLDGSEDHKKKLTQLPLARVKSIMKLDKDNPLMGQGVVFLISKSTELFIQTLARDSHIFTIKNKKKTIQIKDVESAMAHKDYLTFLDGAL